VSDGYGDGSGMSRNTDGHDETESTGRQPDVDQEPAGADPAADEELAGAEPLGGIVIGEFAGGALAAGVRAQAEDSSRQIGLPRGALPPPVVAALPGGIAIGRMTGGAAASGPDARATDQSEQLIEATPQLTQVLALLRGEMGELRTEAAEAEREIQTTGRVERGRLRRLAELAGRAAAAVGGQTTAGVAAEVITGILT
jgi:hypothetical protein